MCVSLSPASFSGTIVYAGEVSARGVHVVGYQNSVQDGANPLDRMWKRLGRGPAGNAMFLHFPAADPMTEHNMLDTEACPHILEDMARAIMPPPPTAGPPTRSLSAGSMPDAVVFTRGVYDVVLARDARYVPQALDRVRPDKRPPLVDAIFRAYSAWFPGWPVALCCFNNRDRARAEPLLWWYRPRNPALLFAPALDAHDGGPPDLTEQVPVDHTVIFGSDRLASGFPVWYRGRVQDPGDDYRTTLNYRAHLAELMPPSVVEARLAMLEERVREQRAAFDRQRHLWHYLPARVNGDRVSGQMRNGDFVCTVSSLLADDLRIERLPPAALASRVG